MRDTLAARAGATDGAGVEERFTIQAVGYEGNGVGLGTPNTPLGHFLQPLE